MTPAQFARMAARVAEAAYAVNALVISNGVPWDEAPPRIRAAWLEAARVHLLAALAAQPKPKNRRKKKK